MDVKFTNGIPFVRVAKTLYYMEIAKTLYLTYIEVKSNWINKSGMSGLPLNYLISNAKGFARDMN